MEAKFSNLSQSAKLQQCLSTWKLNFHPSVNKNCNKASLLVHVFKVIYAKISSLTLKFLKLSAYVFKLQQFISTAIIYVIRRVTNSSKNF